MKVKIMENKNRPAQDIDNNIIPEDNKKDIIIKEEEIISTSTTIDTTTRMSDKDIEEIKPIEQNNTVEEIIPQPTIEPVIEKPKNTVRYIDGGFTF